MDRLRRFWLLGVCLLAAWGLTACGSGGNGKISKSVATSTPVTFDIQWDQRSRAIHAPASALSAVVTIYGANAPVHFGNGDLPSAASAGTSAGSDFVSIVNRGDSPAATTTTFTSYTLALLGTWNMTVEFHALKDGVGEIVGVAHKQVTLKSDGNDIGEIAATGVVASASVLPGQSVQVGQAEDVAFSALDASGKLIAVTQGSALVTVTAGGDKLQLTNYGEVKGLAVGTASLTVTVDGKTSPPVPFTVTPSNPEGPHIYIADTGNNRIVRIDDMTGSKRMVFGTTGYGVGQFQGPCAIAVDSQGRIYIADSFRIVRMDDMYGTNWTTYSGTNANPYYTVTKIALDTQDHIYFTARRSNSWRMDDMTGKNLIPIQNSQLDALRETVPDAQLHLYGVNGNDVLVRLGSLPNGSVQSYEPVWPQGSAPNQITDVTHDSRNALILVDSTQDIVARINNISGANYVSFGGPGTGTNQFGEPICVVTDAQDRIYVVDSRLNRIVRIDDMQGHNWTTYGGGNEPLNGPSSMCIH
ncbi:MAG TPA: NHL repeat-containing protein [Chthonomonadaceae bacterium]|nr:NHL repeat-containing protein [Chthonomonadaceae bacterium]